MSSFNITIQYIKEKIKRLLEAEKTREAISQREQDIVRSGEGNTTSSTQGS